MKTIQSLKELSHTFSLIFVEDDGDLRKSSKNLFESFFDSVTLADNGQEALDLYNEYLHTHGKSIDIIMTDIQMPKKNGIDLTKDILKINPQQKIIAMSAYDDRKHLIDLINLGVSGFIPKPFKQDEIFSTLLKVCQELSDEQEHYRFLDLSFGLQWDHKLKLLSHDGNIIKLTDKESSLIDLFARHLNQKFTSMELFDYLYDKDTEKHFSQDSIKSLIKRLRKKIPHDLISNTPNEGYALLKLS